MQDPEAVTTALSRVERLLARLGGSPEVMEELAEGTHDLAGPELEPVDSTAGDIESVLEEVRLPGLRTGLSSRF